MQECPQPPGLGDHHFARSGDEIHVFLFGEEFENVVALVDGGVELGISLPGDILSHFAAEIQFGPCFGSFVGDEALGEEFHASQREVRTVEFRRAESGIDAVHVVAERGFVVEDLGAGLASSLGFCLEPFVARYGDEEQERGVYDFFHVFAFLEGCLKRKDEARCIGIVEAAGALHRRRIPEIVAREAHFQRLHAHRRGDSFRKCVSDAQRCERKGVALRYEP